MSGRTSLRIAVLMGGPSAEREVSLSSGHECAKALRGEGYEVFEVDPGPEPGLDVVVRLTSRLADINPDVVFNALHGRWGEDGAVQGLLDWQGVPYTHSGVLASALAMDKERSKAVFRAEGIPVAESLLADAEEVRARHVMKPPYVVKPVNEGSSVGIYIVNDGANSPPDLSQDMPQEVMVEAFAPGRELTCTVLGSGDAARALTVTDILTEGWYDYSAKYEVGGSHHILPADVPADIFAACQDYSLKAHKALGCLGVSRTDFRWDEERGLAGLVILETNNQPGMTPTSLSPEQAAYAGISFGAFCSLLVKDALAVAAGTEVST